MTFFGEREIYRIATDPDAYADSTRVEEIARVAEMRRERIREDAAKKQRTIAAGLWPGYCASVRDLESGKWIAIVMIRVAPNRYRRKDSIAQFATSDEAYAAAERWLKREVAHAADDHVHHAKDRSLRECAATGHDLSTVRAVQFHDHAEHGLDRD